ncbi:MAG: LPS-assembly protein LptD [Blastochloris sp.]|nr:LPS-assembly protein LptD [Blastochloris sp.]
MKALGYFWIWLSLGMSLAWALEPGQEGAQQFPIEITADGENRYEGGVAYAEGNVVVRHGLDVIYADSVSYDRSKRELMAKGNVRIFAQSKIYRGEFLTYNLDSQQVSSSEFRLVQDRIYAYGAKVETPSSKEILVNQGVMAFENRENPSYSLKANTIEIYPDDRVVFRNVAVYIGTVPVFWFPYVAAPLDKQNDSFNLSAGSSSRLGAYVIAGYTVALDPRWTVTPYAAYYSRRSVGGGVNVEFDPRPGDRGQFRSFYIADDSPDIGFPSTNRPVIPEEKRYRFDYKHKYQLSPEFNTTADLNIWSDRNVTEDFFRDEFRRDQQPDNYVDMLYYDPNFTASVLARAQVNNLFETVERKPEFKLEFKRQSFFNTFLSYEGESSVVNFKRDFDRDDRLSGPDYGAVRYDSFHQLSYPRQYLGWLSLTPRAGMRGTIYTENNNPLGDDPGGDEGRLAFNAGLEASFKVSKTWSDIKNPGLGIDGIRHVFQPFADYSYMPDTNLDPLEFRGFDERIPSTKLQPTYFSSFNSIDSIDRQNTLRPGVRNKIQTKRDGRNWDLVDWALYTQANFAPSREMGVLSNDTLSHVYNEVAFKPLPWLTANHYSALGFDNDEFTEINNDVTWQVHRALDFTLGHYYLDDVNYPSPFANQAFVLNDSHVLSFGSFWRLNESWKFSQNVYFEADTGTLSEHRYAIYRDVGAWSTALSTSFRDNINGSDEFAVYLSLTLKAFPEANITVNN